MNEPIETIIIRGQQKFNLYDVLNPVQIQMNDDRILNALKKHKNVYDKLTPISILLPPSVTNDPKQIFVTCRTLNDAKIALTNVKIYNMLGIVNVNKINNCEYIEGKSLWVHVNFDIADQRNNNEHIYFSFKTSLLTDLPDFSINSVDGCNKAIEFNSGVKKCLF